MYSATIAYHAAGSATKLDFSDEYEHLEWRFCSMGLNVEGICTTAACKAHGKMTIQPKVRCMNEACEYARKPCSVQAKQSDVVDLNQ